MVVVLAGGTGGAKLARGMLDVVGDELVGRGQHRRRRRDLRRLRLPRSRPVRVLAGRPHRRARLGPARRHASTRWHSCASSGVDVWFNLGDRDLAIGLRRAQRLAEGAHAHRGHRRAHARRSGCGARVLPMADQPVRTRVLARGRWVPFQEFMIRERGEGPVDGVELQGVEAAHAPAGGPRRDRRRARAIDPRAVEPGHLDPHDPRGAGHQRGAARDRRARGRRLARSSAARCSRARPRPS